MVKVIDTSIVSRTEVIHKTKEQIIKEANLPKYFLKLPKYFAELEITKARVGRFTTRGSVAITEEEFEGRKERAKKAYLKKNR